VSLNNIKITMNVDFKKLKSKTMFSIYLGLLTVSLGLVACEKDDVKTDAPNAEKLALVQNNQSELLSKTGITAYNVVGNLISVNSTPLNNAIQEVETTLNRLYGDVSGQRVGLKADTLIYEVNLEEANSVSFLTRSAWVLNSANSINQLQNVQNPNRHIFAIDVVQEVVTITHDVLAEVMTVVYTLENQLVDINGDRCEFLASMDTYTAAEALTFRYNNCRFRALTSYFRTVTQKRYHMSSPDFQDAFWWKEDYLWNTFHKPENKGSNDFPASTWNYYYGRLIDLVNRERPINHDDAMVDIAFDPDPFSPNAFHGGFIIYGQNDTFQLIPQ